MKTIPTLLASFLLIATAGAQEGPNLSSGSEGGTYFKYGQTMADLLDIEHTDSKGSGENLDRLRAPDGQTVIALTQADALADLFKRESSAKDQIDVAGNLGIECAHMVVNTEGEVDDEDDLQNGKHEIAVGESGAGGSFTWQYMTKLEPDYGTSTAVSFGGVIGLNKLLSNDVDAMLFVTMPEVFDNELIKLVNENKKLEFVDLNDKDLNDKLPDGTAVYEFMDINTKDAFFGGSIETICTPLLVVTRKDIDSDLLEKLARIMVSDRSQITGASQ